MRSRPRLRAAAVLLLLPVVSGCSKFQARVEFKKANSDYRDESYRTALEAYQKGLELDPDAKRVWRSLGLAAMALYRPGDDSPANLEFAKRAVDAFERFLEAYPDDEKVSEYLLTTLLNSGQYDAALERLEAEQRDRPNDSKLEDGIVSVLLKAKRLDDAFARVDRNGPGATFQQNYSVGVYCWDKVFRDASLDAPTRATLVARGVRMLERAVGQDPQSFDANVYYGLILREQLKLEADPIRQQALLAEAIKYQERAKAIAQARKAAPAA